MSTNDPANRNNEKKLEALLRLIRVVLTRVLRKGFHGKVVFQASIQDGAIQELETQETQKHRVE